MINYRQFSPSSWIAYQGRQAIWESWSEGQLIRDLKAKGYHQNQLARQNLTIVVIQDNLDEN